MLNKVVDWDVQFESGNPTRSIPVNKLIKNMKKEEVRNRGKATDTTRPFELVDFGKLISLVCLERDPLKKYWYS